ncbi:acyl-CoA dehydrogenase family protein [Pararhodobacter aggregans]|uniref:acyl-CoA dehydrogenase family protein n=1 Tax=Pararhodobacter aggregans TaxID=404875 RepID=UPI003A948653
MTFLEHLNQSDEARMIHDTAARWAGGVADEAVRASKGFSADRWAEMAEMGWLGILAGEDQGGLGMGAAEAAILAGAMGTAKLPEPFIASAVVCAGALTRLPGGAADALLADIAAGQTIAAPAGFGLPCDDSAPCPTATDDGDGLVVSGEVALCEAGPATGVFLLRTGGAETSLVRLDRDAPGLSVIPYRAVDGRHLARLVLTQVPVPAGAILARGPAAETALAHAEALAVAALCADAMGTMDRALALTAAYLNEREQFGRKLASFQALRHLIADMMVEVEFARSMADLAAFGADGIEDPVALLDRARARVCRAAKVVGETSIQLHGGMGMTDEMAIGHYFRRLNFLQAMLGQEAGALRRRAQALAAEVAS